MFLPNPVRAGCGVPAGRFRERKPMRIAIHYAVAAVLLTLYGGQI